ncbi:hypothetical protein [Streptomyces sp. CdTB01]|uniref:hypothetical protein n=1 Tax=Streptomyces sp. CdTB01 TaxID=1725411 RepID=UPI00073ACD1B|nr:hypothetical protein [Streptomyces sp. CdTB01]ALV33796.1 hypothetical protein AS200_18430 [Streptomyces sp. CdTB01]
MRSARMLLATAAASAVLAITAPGAYAADGGWSPDSSSSSSTGKEHDSSSSTGKEHDSSSWSKEHDKDSSHDGPRGGMHTGGGALTAVKGDNWGGGSSDPRFDPDTYRKHGEDSSSDSGGWSGEHEKPHGGMHTGGGALATPTVTAGGLAVLGLAGAGLFAARRRKTVATLA